VTSITTQFLGFALIAILLFNLMPNSRWRRYSLLASSAVFLFFLTPLPSALFPLLAFTAAGFLSLRWVQSGSRYALGVTVGCFLCLFVWLKKYSFLPHGTFLTATYVTVGLSYILFRVLSLLIDTSRGGLTARVPLVSYLCYSLNFTTLISGPIQRYQDFEETLEGPQREPLTLSWVMKALERIVRGAFKVRVLAFLFSTIHEGAVRSVIGAQGDFSERCFHGGIIFVSYTLFLYANFSGYIDVALGIASLLGMKLPENFDRPFSATSFIDFWSRWHITLSNWLKDYVYLPLVTNLMRRFPQRSVEPYIGVLAYFVTFFLVGIWHGSTSVFLFFGLLQGGGVSFNKLFQVIATAKLGRKRYRELSAGPIWLAVSRGLTFTWFTFTLTWFWSDWGQIQHLYSALGPQAGVTLWAGVLVISTIGLACWEEARVRIERFSESRGNLLASRYLRTAWLTALLAGMLAIGFLVNQPIPEIVYGKF
jgi:alginate O-acetyltransferase complex protein AlgI